MNSLPWKQTLARYLAIIGAIAFGAVSAGSAPAAAASNGTISIATQAGTTGIPLGMKAPLFVNWTGPQSADTVTVTLSITSSGKGAAPIAFYSYPSGNNQTMNTGSTPPVGQTCTLSFTPSGGTNTLGCGYGLLALADSGAVTISATATAKNNANSYPIASISLNATTPPAAVRTVSFTNSSSRDIWLGITSGAASSYTGPTTPTIPPGTISADIKPGAGSACGQSNPQAACPMGSTCLQGGAVPGTNTPFYCFYDPPVPVAVSGKNGKSVNPYKIAANGGKVSIGISKASQSPGGVYWSGNFFGRTNCDSANGCDINCNNNNDGGACGPGTGANPGIATLAELTFQKAPNPDYYDVSIINGANFAVAFGPASAVTPAKNSYACGTAGSRLGNKGWKGSSLTNLPAATWQMTPTQQSFPAGTTLPAGSTPKVFYRYISSSGTGTSCTSDSACTTPGEVCGYTANAIDNGTASTYKTTCGPQVAWVTANSIWGFNQSTSSNAAPFGFQYSDQNPSSNWKQTNNSTNVGNYQLCNNNTYSAYQAQGANPTVLACGGVMWGATQSSLPTGNPKTNVGQKITHVSQPAQTASANWLNYVLPTIAWLKQACPTCYTYPFDDMSSTFTCTAKQASRGILKYDVVFSDTQ
jgi:hypothetical protein